MDILDGSDALGDRVAQLNACPPGSQMASAQLIERRRKPVLDRCFGGNVVGTASEVLHEGVARSGA